MLCKSFSRIARNAQTRSSGVAEFRKVAIVACAICFCCGRLIRAGLLDVVDNEQYPHAYCGPELQS
jgi:hypothetical protein